MPYEKISRSGKLCIGTKQASKMIELGKAKEVYIAEDADPKITARIIDLCQTSGSKVIYVDSMKKLGKACGIDVGAAIVAIVDEE